MTPHLLHQLWVLIEGHSNRALMELDDNTLVQQLLDQLGDNPRFDRSQVPTVDRYLRSKLPLIRDLAASA